MVKGIIYALLACFIWGLIFVIPACIEGSFSCLEVALGRYFFYGVVSLLLLFKSLNTIFNYPWFIWKKALWFALASNILYYTALVISVRYASPAISALIIGISPVTIAFYGNWKQRECDFKSLILPSLLIVTGLIIVNVPHISRNLESPSLYAYVFGLAGAFVALISWSWFAVANAHFLKENPNVSSANWSTLVGVTTLLWVFVVGFLLFFMSTDFELNKYLTFTPELQLFLGGCAILGVLCSWVGGTLWNLASLYLPISLAGQLTIFETLFGLSFVCLLEKRVPPPSECVGFAFMLVAILYGIQAIKRAQISVD